MSRTSVLILAVSLLNSCLSPRTVADELVLKSGARLAGEASSERCSKGTHSFRSNHGVQFSVSIDSVAESVDELPQSETYRELAPTIADSPPDHWKLAEWCRRQGLLSERNLHLRRIIELQPDHLAARRALGYSHIDGKWATQRQVLRERGYVYHHGRWRLSQEVALMEERRRKREIHFQWVEDLRHWRTLLNTIDAVDGSRAILAVRDPLAVDAIAQLLKQEQNRRARLLFVETLGEIEDERAIVALANNALSDRDEEAFLASVDQLARHRSPPLVQHFMKALQSSNNSKVNRAGFVLEKLSDKRAIPALIEALMTTHFFRPQNAGQTTYSFARATQSARLPGALFGGSPGSFGSTFGFRKSTVTSYRALNQNVLNALVALANGVSFGYDQEAWRHWYVTQKTPL